VLDLLPLSFLAGDGEWQLITGHSQRSSLAIYQHVAVDGQPADRYQAEMKGVGV